MSFRILNYGSHIYQIIIQDGHYETIVLADQCPLPSVRKMLNRKHAVRACRHLQNRAQKSRIAVNQKFVLLKNSMRAFKLLADISFWSEGDFDYLYI
ncbi:2473_t:CDS:2 [Acaulospora morrowiae]|uniref:2473_t:CDS:1 n=1 Tax=Acaulospora morrowiae TaxID=94023 RepID=A0A9N8VYU9_9GLOM|nr:2473_t:CDS:2 [Acaulospora morrowiae]